MIEVLAKKVALSISKLKNRVSDVESDVSALDSRLNSIKIPKAINGINGINGVDGKDGINGIDGRDGVDGKDGKDFNLRLVEDFKNEVYKLVEDVKCIEPTITMPETERVDIESIEVIDNHIVLTLTDGSTKKAKMPEQPFAGLAGGRTITRDYIKDLRDVYFEKANTDDILTYNADKMQWTSSDRLTKLEYSQGSFPYWIKQYVIIPEYRQGIVHGELIIDDYLENDGQLIVEN